MAQLTSQYIDIVMNETTKFSLPHICVCGHVSDALFTLPKIE
jgi:hypothetical protein